MLRLSYGVILYNLISRVAEPSRVACRIRPSRSTASVHNVIVVTYETSNDVFANSTNKQRHSSVLKSATYCHVASCERSVYQISVSLY